MLPLTAQPLNELKPEEAKAGDQGKNEQVGQPAKLQNDFLPDKDLPKQ
jgi:hypothetical protein